MAAIVFAALQHTPGPCAAMQRTALTSATRLGTHSKPCSIHMAHNKAKSRDAKRFRQRAAAALLWHYILEYACSVISRCRCSSPSLSKSFMLRQP